MNKDSAIQLLPEQQAIVDDILTGTANLLIECPAGGAKTTLYVEASKRMYPQPLLALAFNKRNQQDLEKRMPQWVTTKTFNGLGHSAWAKTTGKRLALDTRKLGDLVSAELKRHPLLAREAESWDAIRALVSAARQAGAIPPGQPFSCFGQILDQSLWDDLAFAHDLPESPELYEVATDVLRASIKLAREGKIDFDDQIYMSTCFGGAFSKFPLIMVDEVQDLSPLNQEMVARSLGKRLICVGDRYQAIYAFRGADAASVESMTKRFALKSLTADTSFRCPQAVVALARKRHPRIQAFEKNPVGEVRYFDEWTLDQIKPAGAILCRNNAPLLALGFKLLKAGRGVNFLGGDLHKSLIKILKSLGPDTLEAELALAALAEWKDKELHKAQQEGKPERAARIHDKHDCLSACFLAAKAKTLGEAREHLVRIFSVESGPLTLSTGHKAKGFEWDNVYILDPWRIPSKWAKEAELAGNPAQMEQELNLRYVMQTRAKSFLAHISLDSLKD